MSASLTQAELMALHDVSLRRVAVVWHDDGTGNDEFRGLGVKPWFALTCGIHPRTLHTLWLDGLLRLDRSAATFRTGRTTRVGRARLTPRGKRALEANR